MLGIVAGTLAFVIPEVALGGPEKAMGLPEEARYWDYVGIFRLKDDKGRAVTVRLYAEDSDRVAEKQAGKGKSYLKFYPNDLSLHAAYRSDGGKWSHDDLFSVGRVHFLRVKERRDRVVFLELQPAFRVDLTKGDREATLKWAAEVNKPFTRRLELKDGRPVITN